MGEGRHVKGEGPHDAKIFLCGEYPGKHESRTGRPFSGPIGREIDRHFNGVRLPSHADIFCTTWVREWCGEDGEYQQADYDRDLPELQAEIRLVQPEIIVALGREVIQYFLGDIDVESCHGLQWCLPTDSLAYSLFANPESVVIHAGYAPGAGFRNAEIGAAIAYDFDQLQAFLDGSVKARKLYDDPYPNPDYRELVTIAECDDYMSEGGALACDSEGYQHAPWSVQLSRHGGTAVFIRVSRVDVCGRFVEWVNSCSSTYQFTFHNALHDLSVFRALGVDTRRLNFGDTMVAAYNLQVEPQGLKSLCVRHLGMSMQSYDDVMGDANFRLAQDWLLNVYETEDYLYESRRQEEFVRLTTTPYTDKKGKVKPGRRLKVAPKLPKTDLHKSIERCLRSKTPRKLWGDQAIDRHVEADPQYGAIWEATLDHVDPIVALRYACRDADGTHRVESELRSRIAAGGLAEVYAADMGTVPLIDRMAQVGIKPDLDHFARLGLDLAEHYRGVLQRIRLHTGDDGFNPNSTAHVGEVLYTRHGLPELKRTPGGDPSTNDKILEALEKSPGLDASVRQLISDIREYREVYKLKHTFCDKIPDFVHRWPFDGRIHASFRITRVVTGRLACSDPNLLAMPKHGKFAQRFREGFVSGDGHVLGSWDLSQIELRVLAHLSQDPVLLRAFRTGEDLHAKLAQRIFGGSEADHKKGTTRLAAKAVNFGIPMGMTNIGLCIELKKNGVDVNEADAQKWLDETMQLYRRVPDYQQEQIGLARQQGFVTSLLGRRRYVGGIRSSDNATRSEAERFAFATPVQAGAADVMKTAEAYIWDHIILPRQDAGQWIEPLLQIHDDLILECEERIIGAVSVEMIHALTQVPAHLLCIPIETSGDSGYNWGVMKEIAHAA